MKDWLNKLIKKDDLLVDSVLLFSSLVVNDSRIINVIKVNNRPKLTINISNPMPFFNLKSEQNDELCLLLMELASGIPSKLNQKINGCRHHLNVFWLFNSVCSSRKATSSRFDISLHTTVYYIEAQWTTFVVEDIWWFCFPIQLQK